MSASHSGMNRSRENGKIWSTGWGRQILSAPFLVAGIVNITPDSFSDGGCFASTESALPRAKEVIAQGAGMVDLGAESTRPGAKDIGHEEEWYRLQPVLHDLLEWREQQKKASIQAVSEPNPSSFDFTIAVDTWRAETAARVLELRISGNENTGAEVINDVSGGSFDPGMTDVLMQYTPGYVLGHSPARPEVMQHNPHYDDVAEELLHWFTSRMDALVRAGVPETCIVLDPCIGFGKTLEHTLAIFKAIPRFLALGRPLYFGISRKTFLGDITDRPARERDAATCAATVLLAQAGVQIHRVHEVAGAVDALKLLEAMSSHVV